MTETVGIDIRGEDHFSPLVRGISGDVAKLSAAIDAMGGESFEALREQGETAANKVGDLRNVVDGMGDALTLFGDKGSQFRSAIEQGITSPALRGKAALSLFDQQMRVNSGALAKLKDHLFIAELQMDGFLGGVGRTRIAVGALAGGLAAMVSTGVAVAIDSVKKFIDVDVRAHRAATQLDKAVDKLSQAFGSALVGGSKNASTALDKLTGIVKGLTEVIEENEESIFEWVKTAGEGSVKVLRFVARVGLGLRTIVAMTSDGFGLLFRSAEVSFLSFKELAQTALVAIGKLWLGAAEFAEKAGLPFVASAEQFRSGLAALKADVASTGDHIRYLNGLPVMPETEAALKLWDQLDNLVDGVLGKVSGAKGGGAGRRRGGGGSEQFDGLEKALNQGLTLTALEDSGTTQAEISLLLGEQAAAWRDVAKSMREVNAEAERQAGIPDDIQRQIDGIMALRSVLESTKEMAAEFAGTLGEAFTNVAFGSEDAADAARRVFGGLLSDIGRGAIAQAAVISLSPLWGPAYGIPLAVAGGILVGVGNEIAGRGGGGGGGASAAQSVQRTTLPQMEREAENRQAVIMFGDRPVRGYMTDRERDDRRLRRI
jgi:hypothetical protein